MQQVAHTDQICDIEKFQSDGQSLQNNEDQVSVVMNPKPGGNNAHEHEQENMQYLAMLQ